MQVYQHFSKSERGHVRRSTVGRGRQPRVTPKINLPTYFCPELVLDPLGHHAASCRHGGDVVTRHNRLRDFFVEFCRQAHLSVRVEAGFGLSRVQRNTRPADVLV